MMSVKVLKVWGAKPVPLTCTEVADWGVKVAVSFAAPRLTVRTPVVTEAVTAAWRGVAAMQSVQKMAMRREA